jgi:site-specific recombinase XerD
VDGYEACRAALREEGRVRRQRGPNGHSLTSAALLIRFLREQGVLAAASKEPTPRERWPVLEEFRRWTVQHRGVAESSMTQYESMVAELLAALGADPATYGAESIRRFVVERSRGHGIPRAQTITTAVRAFLRFLAANGRCPDDLLNAVPRFANWRLSSTPRFLEPQEVERLIGACHDDSALGARARAVILLLARLGLRASDVAGLTFDDIDWSNGRIAVCGKGRRHEWLPLPQEIGDAILGYLRRGRAPLPLPQVFTSVLAPHQPMTRAAVTHVVRSALRQAGIKAPVNGAHLLRHSAATAMLRSGASLAAVGAVLRHRSPNTTAHYAKVDFGLLSEIAQPWPEVPPC